jgi:hypothetical protein
MNAVLLLNVTEYGKMGARHCERGPRRPFVPFRAQGGGGQSEFAAAFDTERLD